MCGVILFDTAFEVKTSERTRFQSWTFTLFYSSLRFIGLLCAIKEVVRKQIYYKECMDACSHITWLLAFNTYNTFQYLNVQYVAQIDHPMKSSVNANQPLTLEFVAPCSE